MSGYIYRPSADDCRTWLRLYFESLVNETQGSAELVADEEMLQRGVFPLLPARPGLTQDEQAGILTVCAYAAELRLDVVKPVPWYVMGLVLCPRWQWSYRQIADDVFAFPRANGEKQVSRMFDFAEQRAVRFLIDPTRRKKKPLKLTESFPQ